MSPTLVQKTPQDQPDFLPNVLRIAEILASFKGKLIKAYDLRELTVVADCFVLCSVSSEPQFKAVYNGVREGMKTVGVSPLRVEGEVTGGWLIVDYGNIVLHVFRETAREFYDLDGLWGDAPQVALDLD